MVFCHKCGNELPDDAQYCNKCGITLLGSNSKIEEKPARIRKERSGAWYLAPIFFGLIGGLVAYFVVRNDEPKLARNCLIIGVIIFVVVFIIIIASGVSALDNNIVR